MTNNVKAILWALLATAFFSLGAALVKLAIRDYHILQILFFRQSIVLLTILPSLVRVGPSLLQTKRPALHALRLIAALVALLSGFWAVSGLPLTTAVTLGFTSIFFVSGLAFLFPGETLGPHRLAAIGLGFIGVLVTMRPDLGGLGNLYSLAAVLSAFAASIATVCVRSLTRTEATPTLLVYFAFFIGLISGLPMLWLWKQPSLQDAIILIGMGLSSSIGHWFSIRALRLGQAGIVKSIEYVSLIYTAILGYLIFAEIPDDNTLLGAAIIIVASLYILYREHVRRNKTKMSSENAKQG
jgi:drug/metabolite transporter (DMT)-like permease